MDYTLFVTTHGDPSGAILSDASEALGYAGLARGGDEDARRLLAASIARTVQGCCELAAASGINLPAAMAAIEARRQG